MKALIVLILGFPFASMATKLVTDEIRVCRLSLNGNQKSWTDQGVHFKFNDHTLSWTHTNNGKNAPAVYQIPEGETIKRVVLDRHNDRIYISTSYQKIILDSHTGRKIVDVGFVGDENNSKSVAKMTETTFASWGPTGYMVAFGYNNNREEGGGGLYAQFFSPQTRLMYDSNPLGTGDPIRIIWSASGNIVGIVFESSVKGKYLLLQFDLKSGAMRNSLPRARNGISQRITDLQFQGEGDVWDIQQNRNNGGSRMDPISARSMTEEEIAEAMKGAG